MAKCIVLPKIAYGTVILKCQRCGTLYVPESTRHSLLNGTYFEACPHCGCEYNDAGNKIPLWKYNLIKWWRTGFKEEEEDDEYGSKKTD